MNAVKSLYLSGDGNVGDAVCSPLLYFQFPGRNNSFHNLSDFQKSGPCIIGGGGLLNEQILTTLEGAVAACVDGPIIGWGLGSNFHNAPPLEVKVLEKFTLLGLRDYRAKHTIPVQWHYVPCASCMHPMFKDSFNIRHSVVVYEHQSLKIPILKEVDRMSNLGGVFDFFDVIGFLGSAETIVTNTYHGLYWAMLLGKRVVCWKPFSTRFRTLKPEVTFCDESNWQEAVEHCEPAPAGYLDECRERNQAFYDKVKTLV